jgi:predicted glycoside hydrolase/deacetylase ChbG (UPF0249 family)
MIQLIVNADDLGLHPAIDEGIFRAHKDGIVTSTTVLVTSRNAQAAAPRAKEEGLAIGVHLCLSTSFPPAAPADEVPTVAPGGRFRSRWTDFVADAALGRVRWPEVDRELRAQVARARELGIEPDHLDGHQHLHVLPGASAIVAQIARDEGLPLRWPAERPRAAWLRRPGSAAKAALLSSLALPRRPRGVATARGLGAFETNHLDEEALLGVVASLSDGIYDLCAHPGLTPDSIPEDPTWREGRETELNALCSSRVKARIRERGISLTTYASLR